MNNKAHIKKNKQSRRLTAPFFELEEIKGVVNSLIELEFLSAMQADDFVYQLFEVLCWNQEFQRSISELKEAILQVPRNSTRLRKITASQMGSLRHHIEHVNALVRHLDRLCDQAYAIMPRSSLTPEELEERDSSRKYQKLARKLTSKTRKR
ncbi:MAG: hypothetical protein IPK83_19905 [Planctomycetes bacterium]|nr:hypothetical protein [Planctomycetota bacterium]